MEDHPFISLIEQHQAAIEKVCRTFCRTSPEDREDLRQEVLLHLWQGWKRYRPDGRTVTWVYRVAINTAVSYRRRQLRRLPTVPLDAFDPPDDSALRERCAHLRALVSLLAPPDRRMAQLYLDGFTSAEIARLTGSTVTAVTSRMVRIKEKLRKLDQQ